MRTKCTVEKVVVSPFITTEKRPFEFLHRANVLVWLTRTYKDGKKHWGSDNYGVRQFATATWTVLE